MEVNERMLSSSEDEEKVQHAIWYRVKSRKRVRRRRRLMCKYLFFFYDKPGCGEGGLRCGRVADAKGV